VSNSSNRQHDRLPIWITNLLSRLEERIFHKSDARAAERGWEVRRTGRGLGRSYRDPRFDLLAACAECGGTGFVGAAPHRCHVCGGSGRVRLDPPGETPRAAS